MALTFSRWIVATALGAAAVWVGLFHTRAARTPASEIAPPSFSTGTVATQAGAAMTRAADRLRLLEIRDSVLRQPTTHASGSLTVSISAAYGSEITRQLDSLIRERWSAAGVAPGTRTVIAAVIDTATAVASAVRPRVSTVTSITAFAPDSIAGLPCVSILRVPAPIDSRVPASFRRDLLAPETIGALIGPCLYYAAFGAPGPSIARWLRDGGWRLSHVTDWQAPAPTFGPTVGARLAYATGVESFAYEPRRWTTTEGLACLAGEAGRCMAALVPPRRLDADTVWRQHVVTAIGANENLFRMPRGRSALGPSEGWLLSEMVRTLGPERFAAFWRSGEPLADAFRKASNESLDEWVHDWAVRMYGPMPIGPGLNRPGLVAGVALLIVAIIGTAAVARARRVT